MPRPTQRSTGIACWCSMVVAIVYLQATTIRQRFEDERELRHLAESERAATHAALDAIGVSPAVYAGWWLATSLVFLLTYLFLGWLLITRGQPSGFSTWVACVMLGLSVATYPPDIDATFAGRPTQEAIVRVMTAIGITGFFTLPTVFPSGRFVPRWTAAIVVPLVGYLIAFIVFDTDPWPTSGWLDAMLTLALFGTFIGAAIWRYRRVSSAPERRATRWVVFGFLVGLPGFVAADAMMRNVDDSMKGVAYLIGFSILIQVGFNAPFLAVGSAMAFHRLFDIDVMLGRTLVWAAMTAIVIGAYVAVVIGLGELAGTGDQLVMSLVATGIVAVAFQPVRARVQRVVNRFVFGDRDDPYSVISRIGAHATGTLGELLPNLVHLTAESLRLPYVALYIDTAGEMALATAIGTPAGQTTRFPLAWQGRSVGALDVAPRGPGEAFNGADRRLLEDLARQIGLAVHATTLAYDLQASRERLVASREEERRRLRRDLHDGLGAQLAALSMQTSAARALIRRDPEAAELELDLLRDELKHAIDDIRRLVQGLRPPALDELGLEAALRLRLDRMVRTAAANVPAVHVEIDLPPSLPAATEVAAYRIVEEAIANVLKHAHARTVTLSMIAHDDVLNIAIRDDGCGIAGDRGDGIGFHSMRERAIELGGRVTFGPNVPAPGSCLRAVLPLERWR